MTAPAHRQTAIVHTPEAKQHFVYSTPVGKLLTSDEAKSQIVPLLPHGVEYERVMLEVYRAATQNSDIMRCTPESIVMAVGAAVQTGLIIGKTIHLVPVSNKLQAWTDYKGDIELVLWSGAARAIDAQCVYQNDHFPPPMLGSNPRIEHRPALKDRGPLIGAYCVAWLNGTGTLQKIVYMPLEDIEKIRAKSKSWSPTKVGKECPPWYAMKTTVHANCKTLPKNQRLAKVLALFEHQDRIDHEADGAESLDPSRRIEAPDPAQLDIEQAIAQGAAPGVEAIAEPEWTPPSQTEPEAPARSAAAQLPIPFGPTRGTAIGDMDEADLVSALKWALRQGGKYQAFIDAANELLEERRLPNE